MMLANLLVVQYFYFFCVTFNILTRMEHTTENNLCQLQKENIFNNKGKRKKENE